MKKLFALLLIVFPLVAQAATSWEFDWETLPTVPADVSKGIWYQGNCFSKAAGDPFNSVELSTKYKRTGSKSARLYTDSKYSNSEGHNDCFGYLKTTDKGEITIDGVKRTFIKHRNEPKFAYLNDPSNDFQVYQIGEERWFRYSFYLPSDEGTFNYWNTGPYADKGVMIMQIFANNNPASAGDGTHEVAFILKGGPKMAVERVYGPDENGVKETFKTIKTLNLKKDAWNDVVFMHVPRNDSNGKLKVWLNCIDWAACTPSVDFSGPVAIARFLDRYWKGGNYEMHVPEWNRAIAQYIDSHRMAKRGAENDAQMLAYMADAFTTPGGGGGGGGGGFPTETDMVINSGNPISTNQNPINFTVSNVTDITNCIMNTTPLAVKFDYTTGTSGKFAGEDTTGYPNSGNIKCYDETVFANPDLEAITWSNGSGVTSADLQDGEADNWGYTAGRRISKAGSGTGEAFFVYGTSYTTLVNDKARMDIRYSCSGNSCQNMYFDIGHNVGTGEKRIRLSGTAGALTYGQAASVPLHGSGYGIRNYTMPDNTYGVVFWWTVSEAHNYKMRAGWTADSAANLSMDIHEWVMRKNWQTKELVVPVTYGVADSTAPILSNCSVNNVRNGEGSYTATLLCNADEIGGTDYAMITTSNTVPDEAAMKAATGAIWSSQKSADTSEIAFEAGGMIYQDLWSWVMRCDTATVSNCSTVVGSSFTAVERVLALGTSESPINNNGLPLNATYTKVIIYDKNILVDTTAKVVTILQNVPVINGIANPGNAYTMSGYPSLNTIPTGEYWVMASRPSGASYAMSYSKRNIVEN